MPASASRAFHADDVNAGGHVHALGVILTEPQQADQAAGHGAEV
jgi:hypothetical protein